MRNLVTVIAVLLTTSQASALSGVELYSFCVAEEETVESLSCTSYVRGFTDGIMAGKAAAGESAFCPPAEGINALQARLIVEKFLRDHPEPARRSRFAGDECLLRSVSVRLISN